MSRYRTRSLTANLSSRALLQVALGGAVLLLVVTGGVMTLLATWDIPVPTEKVERVLPDERFPR